MTKSIANIITFCRIIGSILLLLFPTFSVGFYIVYFLCGFSDMIDGAIARKTRAVSSFGSKLDTVADAVFMAVCAVKLLPIINIPMWLWIWIAVIAIIKIGNIIFGFICWKKFIDSHTVLNKITGALLFILPLTLRLVESMYSFAFVCAVATVAAILEGYCVIKTKDE